MLFAWLLLPFNAFAVGVTSTPVANNFSASYDGAKVNLSWVNSNRIELTSADASNGNINKWHEHSGTFGTISIDNGILSCTYTNDADYPLSIIEILLPGADVAGVNSFMFDYTCDNNYKCYAIIREVETNNAWTVYGSDYVDYAPATSILAAPNHAIWAGAWGLGNSHGTYGDRHFYSIGIAPNPKCKNNSNVSFTLSNLYFNTTSNRTALKIVRKIGGVPSSVSDGTVIDITAGSTNSYIDNTVSNGNTYYYAVFAEINSVWTKIAESSEVVVGSVKDDVDLSLNSTEVTVPVGGLFTLTHTTADGYDGSISYSVAPEGVINFNESTGVITGIQMGGSATIKVTASETSNFIGDTKTCTVNVTKNFVGDLSIEEAGGNVTLNWFYNLPISLATEGDDIAYNGSYTTTYADGIRYFTYTLSDNTENKYFGACDFKTPNVPNCKSFSFEYRGENNGTNPRVVPYAWLDGGAPNSGNIVANPVKIRSTWDEVTVIPSCNYYAGAANINNGAIDGLNFASHPVGCVAFFPMADGDVSEGTLQLRNAYFQLINTNGLTTSVSLVRKKDAAPVNASDGTTIYWGNPTTFVDNTSTLDAGTYYYRVFATYGGYTYMSEAQSITISGSVDPELALNETSTTLTVGDEPYSIVATTAEGYHGTLEYSVLPATGVVNITPAGVITPVGGGTATIQVIAPAEGDYRSASVNFTVKVYNTNPLVIPTGGTRLNASNVESCKGKVDFVIDDENQSVDISGKSTAEWRVKFVQGRYKARLAYGTPGYSVNVTMKIFDGDSELMIVGSEHHEDGEGEHIYHPTWSIDLTEIDEDKVYTVKVIDTYGDATSQPRVGYIDFSIITPTPIANGETTLGASNVSYDPGTVSFDIMNNGQEVPCLNIEDQKKADWYVTIQRGTYNISMLYGTPNYDTNVTLSILDPENVNEPIYSKNVIHYGSGHFHELVMDNDINLGAVVPAKEYIVRIEDTYDYDGSRPKVAYIKFENQTPSLTYYERTVTPGEYGTVCIGYAVEHENISGAEIYEIDSWSNDGKTLILSELGASENMVAGQPYIFYATASTLSLGYDDSAAEAPAGSHNGLIGSYSQEQITANDDNYIIYNNKLYLVTGTNYVGANRAYIHKQATNPSPAPRRRVTMGLYGTQTATGIDNLQGNDVQCIKFMENGVLYILRDGIRYNAMGTKIQ